MKEPYFTIMILVSITLVSVGFVLAAPALVAPQNNWDPRVYDPLMGIQDESTTKTSIFYNISLSTDAIESTIINKIQFEPYPSPLSIQNTTNLMVYMNGSVMLKPFNLHTGDNVHANLLVPVADIQPNMTYQIEIYTDSMYYCSAWNTTVYSPA
jgi:hypothetical protein